MQVLQEAIGQNDAKGDPEYIPTKDAEESSSMRAAVASSGPEGKREAWRLPETLVLSGGAYKSLALVLASYLRDGDYTIHGSAIGRVKEIEFANIPNRFDHLSWFADTFEKVREKEKASRRGTSGQTNPRSEGKLEGGADSGGQSLRLTLRPTFLETTLRGRFESEDLTRLIATSIATIKPDTLVAANAQERVESALTRLKGPLQEVTQQRHHSYNSQVNCSIYTRSFHELLPGRDLKLGMTPTRECNAMAMRIMSKNPKSYDTIHIIQQGITNNVLADDEARSFADLETAWTAYKSSLTPELQEGLPKVTFTPLYSAPL